MVLNDILILKLMPPQGYLVRLMVYLRHIISILYVKYWINMIIMSIYLINKSLSLKI